MPQRIPLKTAAYRQPISSGKNEATIGRVNTAAAAPKLPHPAYIPWASPIFSGGNHSEIILIPTTNPAPTIPMSRRAIRKSSKPFC